MTQLTYMSGSAYGLSRGLLDLLFGKQDPWKKVFFLDGTDPIFQGLRFVLCLNRTGHEIKTDAHPQLGAEVEISKSWFDRAIATHAAGDYWFPTRPRRISAVFLAFFQLFQMFGQIPEDIAVSLLIEHALIGEPSNGEEESADRENLQSIRTDAYLTERVEHSHWSTGDAYNISMHGWICSDGTSIPRTGGDAEMLVVHIRRNAVISTYDIM